MSRITKIPAKLQHTVFETATLCWDVTDEQLDEHRLLTGKAITPLEYARTYFTTRDADAIIGHGDVTVNSTEVVPARIVRRVG